MKGGRIGKQEVFSRGMDVNCVLDFSKKSLFIHSAFTGLTTPVNIGTY